MEEGATRSSGGVGRNSRTALGLIERTATLIGEPRFGQKDASMTGGDETVAINGTHPVPPPGWARVSDRIRARVFARAIDEKLLNGGAANGSALVIVRRARLLNPRYRSRVATALRKLVAAARRSERNMFVAQLRLREDEILESEPLILTLADELEHEDRVSPRGVILADRLITDGDSPVYGPIPIHHPREETVESAVRRARAALHMG
jgi:hypothetical protein